ncbi:extracellularly regulated kinase 7 [Lycorma delicatula]|uniref:extracellularly regulated kinase 7 n=1 Tax=Lycorma delicatula TaxID=130591 RepID=UPI003F512CB0
MGENVREIDETVTNRYEIKRRIGKGAYGIVWKAVDKRTKEVVAVKKIFDAFRNQTDAQRTYREIVFLRELRAHPNIVQLHNILRATNNKDIYLVFEFMETDLHNVIKHGEILRDIHKRYIIYQLLKALKYIHSGNVIHRDLKPCNILLDSQCQCKVADFGLARSVTQINGGSPSDPTLTDYIATRWYRAPEILIASKKYTKGIDMWSVGCILAEMLLGKPLFPGSSTVNQVEKIMSTITPPSATDVDSVCTGYGSNLLQRTPPGPHTPLESVLADAAPDSVDLVSRLLVFNPHKRLTAAEALEQPYVAKFHNSQKEVSMVNSVIPPLCDDIQLSVDEYRNKLYEAIRGSERRNSNAKHSHSAGDISQNKYNSHFYTWCNISHSRNSTSKFGYKEQTSESPNEELLAKKKQQVGIRRKPVTHPPRTGAQSSASVGHSHHRHSLRNSQLSHWKAVAATKAQTTSAPAAVESVNTRKKVQKYYQHQEHQLSYKKSDASGDHIKLVSSPQEQHHTTELVKTSTCFQPTLKTVQKVNVVRHMVSSKKSNEKFTAAESPQERKIFTHTSDAPPPNQIQYSQKYGYITSAELQELRPGIRW